MASHVEPPCKRPLTWTQAPQGSHACRGMGQGGAQGNQGAFHASSHALQALLGVHNLGNHVGGLVFASHSHCQSFEVI